MKLDENSSSQSGSPLLPQRSMAVAPDKRPANSIQDAAAQVVRLQIDNIYASDEAANSHNDQRVLSHQLDNINPYQREHSQHPLPQYDQWKEYHSAWQSYYQKYYESYYTHHLRRAQNILQEQATASQQQNNRDHLNSQTTSQPEPEEVLTSEEAVFDLRQKLIAKVQESATKVRKSRHFIPITAGLIVVLLFLFLQYNRVIIANITSYVSPGSIDPQNIVIDPNTNVKVGPDPRLIIPKINVDVPVLYDVGNDYNSQMAAMTKGVAQFAIPGASSHPGQVGNTIIAGHSSNDLLDTGDYKFIFAQLDRLTIGDTIYANYNSIRYTYTVTGKQVVKPTDVSKLVYSTTKPILTLLTCTPLGTSINRLLIIAEQVSPDPSQSTTAPIASSPKSTSIPGSSPTLLERIFGGGN
jgi:sortase A